MTSNPHICRTAPLYIGQHSDDTTLHAAMRADEMLDKGALDGRAVWLRVIRAIKEMQDNEPGGTIH